MEEPTSEMIKEVKATDPYVFPVWKHEYPRIQILTVEDLLKGKKPNMPPTISPFHEANQIDKQNRFVQRKLPI
ncbi:MAG: hypothetical protein ABSG57_14040 [Candidatus Bathyarchaeia archaeon]|jgi:hypothetical protein